MAQLTEERVIHPGGRTSTDQELALGDVQPGERVLYIAPLMRQRAGRAVAAAHVAPAVKVTDADIRTLPNPDNSYDCRPVGRVLATEFYWRSPPTAEARGVAKLRSKTGPLDMVTARGFITGESLPAFAVMCRALSRPRTFGRWPG